MLQQYQCMKPRSLLSHRMVLALALQSRGLDKGANLMNDEIMTERIENINNLLSSLADMQDCYCYVLCYQSGHHQLTLAVFDPDLGSCKPNFYLHFEPTYYFEGPMGWSGVDFRLATQDEWKKVLLKIKVSGEIVDEFIKHHFLFVLEKPGCQVKILSANCEKITKALHVSASYADS